MTEPRGATLNRAKHNGEPMKIGAIRRIEVEGGGYASEPAVARGEAGDPWMAWMRRTDPGREEVWVGRADLPDLLGDP